jgi:PKD repeat protein
VLVAAILAAVLSGGASGSSADDVALVWLKRAGGTGSEHGKTVAVLSDNSTVVTGSFSDTAIFGSGEANETQLVSAGSGDIFIARYNSDGTLTWAVRNGRTGWDDVATSAAELADSTLIVIYTHPEASTTHSDGGGSGMSIGQGCTLVISNYSNEGSKLWDRNLVQNGNQGVSSTLLLPNGDLIIAGSFRGSPSQFLPGAPGAQSLTTLGSHDIFLMRLFLSPLPTVTASGTPTSGQAPYEVAFTTAQTAGAAVTEWRWDFDGDGNNDYVSAETGTVRRTYGQAGSFTARLTAVDRYARTVTKTVGVTVTAAPSAPTVSASADTTVVTAGIKINFTGNATVPGGVEWYAWDFNGDGVNDFASIDTCATSETYTLTGTYQAKLTVLDREGRMTSNTIAITVNAALNPPTSAGTATPRSGVAPLKVVFDPAGTGNGGNQVWYYEWDYEGDGTYDWRTTNAAYIRPTGGAWRRVAGATVRRDDKVVEVVITHHSVVGLGGPGGGSSSSSAAASSSACLLTRAGLPGQVLCWLRAGRDLVLGSAAGRLITGVYYLVFG